MWADRGQANRYSRDHIHWGGKGAQGMERVASLHVRTGTTARAAGETHQVLQKSCLLKDTALVLSNSIQAPSMILGLCG